MNDTGLDSGGKLILTCIDLFIAAGCLLLTSVRPLHLRNAEVSPEEYSQVTAVMCTGTASD